MVAYVPNPAEAVVGFLAASSLGAMWSSCGMDYSPAAAAARLGQLDPVVLVAADGYRFGGRLLDRRLEVRQLRAQQPTLRETIVFDRIGADFADPSLMTWTSATERLAPIAPLSLPFNHRPLGRPPLGLSYCGPPGSGVAEVLSVTQNTACASTGWLLSTSRYAPTASSGMEAPVMPAVASRFM